MNKQINNPNLFETFFWENLSFFYSYHKVGGQTTNIEMVLSMWMVVLGCGNS